MTEEEIRAALWRALSRASGSRGKEPGKLPPYLDRLFKELQREGIAVVAATREETT